MARLQGAVVASSQCFGTSGRLALAPVADWLRNPAVQAAAATLDPAWRAEVGGWCRPEGRGERAAGSRAMVDAWQRHRFFEGLARALMAVGRPDAAGAGQHAVVRPGDAGLPHVLPRPGRRHPGPGGRDAARTTPRRGPELADWIVRMRATGLLTELSLEPAGSRPTRPGWPRRSPGGPCWPDDANLLQATTGGFPLYVIEAVRGRADPGSAPLPPAISPPCCATASSRRPRPPGRWPGWPRRSGANFTLDLLTEASDLDADNVVEAVDELWRRRIMREFA